MTHAEFLRQLLPPTSYDPNGQIIQVEWAASGARFDEFQGRVEQFLREIDPRTVSETLEDWERVYGLPDPCFPLGQTLAQRLLALAIKVVDRGGLSRAYFLSQVAALGYSAATIEEFDAGVVGEIWRYRWRINVVDTLSITTMTCNSECDDPLRRWGNEILECLMNRLKPAHTEVLFAYGA